MKDDFNQHKWFRDQYLNEGELGLNQESKIKSVIEYHLDNDYGIGGEIVDILIDSIYNELKPYFKQED